MPELNPMRPVPAHEPDNSLTEDEIRALVADGKIGIGNLKSLGLSPDEAKMAIHFIATGTAEPMGAGQAVTQAALVQGGVGLAGPVAGVIGAGLSKVLPNLPKAAKWIGAGVGAKVGHPVAGYYAGRAAEKGLGRMFGSGPAPGPAPSTGPANFTGTGTTIPGPSPRGFSRGPTTTGPVPNPGNVTKLDTRVPGQVSDMHRVEQVMNPRAGVQNDFRGRVTFQRSGSTPRPEFPPGAGPGTSPSLYRSLEEAFAESQGDPAEVEAIRRFIAAALDRR
jgi:hypothetical protein